MSFFVRARFDIHDGRQADFEEAALALRAQAAEEPETLRYRWFSNAPGSYVAIEEYVDADAAMTHNDRGAKHLERIFECAELVSAEIYGPIGPWVREWADTRPQVTLYADFPDPDQPSGQISLRQDTESPA
ncbi:putative quinol monooxygenase [Nocardia acidivorans]|uniref:putative quinol monooxygenase n=1 Tax=Nocardia acidivorans TaxID=404580 RepID=UPI00082CEF58|nr:antibiotic biosynthesis monooxygenase [Nocardia acidivorans]